MRILVYLSLAIFLLGCQSSNKKESSTMNPQVTIQTSLGNIQVELYAQKAPITVANFLRYVDENFYNHTIFHRVIDGFMIQGGGMDGELKSKKTHDPIRNEADNGLSNQKGTLAMARTSEIHSASSQFFINVADNTFLDHRSPTPSGFGYCVFGKVTAGMDVVEKIKAVKTGSKNGYQDVPSDKVEILKIVRKEK